MIKIIRSIEKIRLARNSSTSEINVPNRIPRDPTDILKTLASTVRRDTTAAHYKYHDDPYLIPISNVGKRTFAMAQESGRKAAKWIVSEHPDLFQHKVAEPFIEVFAPKAIYDENSRVGEETLLKVIDGGQVTDALTIYELMSKRNYDVSAATNQALLELVCFYNAEDGIPDDFIEERWFSHSNKNNSDVVSRTWKDNGFAEGLFKKMSTPTPAAYSAIIQGMTKFGQAERAWQTYEKACERGFELTTETYNSLLRAVNTLKQKPEMRWEMLQAILASMARAQEPPNLGTLNAVLETIANMGGSQTINHALAVLAEFHAIGVEPSLGSYSYLLRIYARDRNNANNTRSALVAILSQIEGKEFTIRHPSDVSFFGKAMEVCRYQAQDINLGRRIDDLLHVGNNYNLIGDSHAESVYYRNFFMLLCSTETIDKIMEVYNVVVPNIYTPEPSVTQEILRVIDQSGEIELIPQLWADMVDFFHNEREPVLIQLLDCLTRNEPAPGSSMIATYADIALQIWEKIENQPINKTNIVRWTGEMLSNVLLLLVRAQKTDEARLVMKKIGSDEQSHVGEPKIDALCAYVDLCVTNNDADSALTCLRVCRDIGFTEVLSMAKDLRSRISLTDEQALKLAQLVDDS